MLDKEKYRKAQRVMPKNVSLRGEVRFLKMLRKRRKRR